MLLETLLFFLVLKPNFLTPFELLLYIKGPPNLQRLVGPITVFCFVSKSWKVVF